MKGDHYFHPAASLLTDNCLKTAMNSLKRDYWMEGFKYQARRPQLGRLMYRNALYTRLLQEPYTSDNVLLYIDRALRMCPNDGTIIKSGKQPWNGLDKARLRLRPL
ncbi:hypothetical protein BDV96DRAFT_585548 [Lophiotrema nucula]|uniref:Uncharacterized protein n=1 Tax=Lophiotrema nucula TaxID=690887 RepID=A0A6A5YQM4_9PLEO|nr:hypothetical protein BDV96DRAFT_585548 [Lophiotrema nucula]